MLIYLSEPDMQVLQSRMAPDRAALKGRNNQRIKSKPTAKLLAFLSVVLAAMAPSTGDSQQIDPSRGANPHLDYEAMVEVGPWDDRNYQLTEEDLEILAPNERELQSPLPLFYRVLMRRANPSMQNQGPAQYPRSALPSFLQNCGGYLVNGRYFRTATFKGGRYYVIMDTSSVKEVSTSPRMDCRIRKE